MKEKITDNDSAKKDNDISPDIIVGKNAVTEALKSGIGVNRLQIARGAALSPAILELAKEHGAAVEYVSREILDKKAAGMKHQGVLAHISPVPFANLDDVLRRAEQKNRPPFLILLDGVEDPHNAGAILRSAEAAGVDGVLLPKRRTVTVGATVAKTSAGAVFHVPLIKIGNAAQTLVELKKRGFWVFGAEASGKENYYEADWLRAVVLVIGGEGNGISNIVKRECDFLVQIPMYGKVNSLNASAAAAILLFEAVKQRTCFKETLHK